MPNWLGMISVAEFKLKHVKKRIKITHKICKRFESWSSHCTQCYIHQYCREKKKQFLALRAKFQHKIIIQMKYHVSKTWKKKTARHRKSSHSDKAAHETHFRNHDG